MGFYSACGVMAFLPMVVAALPRAGAGPIATTAFLFASSYGIGSIGDGTQVVGARPPRNR